LAGGQKRPEQLLDVLPRAPELRAVSPAAAAAELNGCRPSSCTAGKEAHTESRTGVTARVLVDSHVGATEGLKDVHQWRLRSRAGLPRPGQNRRRPRARAVRPRPQPRTRPGGAVGEEDGRDPTWWCPPLWPYVCHNCFNDAVRRLEYLNATPLRWAAPARASASANFLDSPGPRAAEIASVVRGRGEDGD